MYQKIFKQRPKGHSPALYCLENPIIINGVYKKLVISKDQPGMYTCFFCSILHFSNFFFLLSLHVIALTALSPCFDYSFNLFYSKNIFENKSLQQMYGTVTFQKNLLMSLFLPFLSSEEARYLNMLTGKIFQELC